jgi:hypothetical protein
MALFRLLLGLLLCLEISPDLTVVVVVGILLTPDLQDILVMNKGQLGYWETRSTGAGNNEHNTSVFVAVGPSEAEKLLLQRRR